MGHYLNSGNEGFKWALRTRIYVDKSGIIDNINSALGTDDGYICVSRARRFGKSRNLKYINLQVLRSS